MAKTCLECEKELDFGKIKYCSLKCSNRAISRRKREKELSIRVSVETLQKLEQLAEKQQDLNGFLQKEPNCEVCGANNLLILHHISYNPIQIITLCASCHSLLHNRFLKKKKVQP